MSTRVLCAAVLVVSLAAPPVSAQDAAHDPAREARAHFDRGIALFNEGRLDAALPEFQAAYDIAPAYPVLYNLGRVYAALERPVEAAHALERYLAEGGDAIAAARQREVLALIADARARIGRVDVVSDVAGSVVSVDGVDVATTPLSFPIELGVGRHTIGVRAPGYETITRALDLAGGVEERVSVELRPVIARRGSLRITSVPTGITITIDGVEVGHTPLDATIPVPEGAHTILGTRAGYLPEERHVTVDDGAEVEVRLGLDVDPEPVAADVGALLLRLPEGRAIVRIDGTARDAVGALSLPVGAHSLEVEAEDRERYDDEITITSETTLELTPPLAWSPSARRDRISGADAQRSAGIGLAIGGGALFLVSLGVLFWNEAEIAATDSRISELRREYEMMHCPPITPRCDEIEIEAAGLLGRQSTQDVVRGITIAGSVVGGLLGALGLGLVLRAPSEADVDAAAHAELRIGPGGLTLSGTF